MTTQTLLTDVWELIKIIGIPIFAFLAIRFINTMDKLRKDVNILINKMSQREVYCTDQHTVISEKLKKNETEHNEFNDTLVEHDKQISKVKGILKLD